MGYTLRLANNSSTTDVFNLSADGPWPVMLPPVIGPLAAGETQAFEVTVLVPPLPFGANATTMITAVSQTAPDVLDSEALVTEVNEARLYLPAVERP